MPPQVAQPPDQTDWLKILMQQVKGGGPSGQPLSPLAYDSGTNPVTRAPSAAEPNPLSPMAAPTVSPVGIPATGGGAQPPASPSARPTPAQAMSAASAQLPQIRSNMNFPKDSLSRLQKYLNDQEQGVNTQNEMVKAAASVPSQTNLAPLLSMIDSFSGGHSKLAESYQQPESPQKRAMDMVKLQNVALQDQQGLTKDQISLLNSGNRDETKLLSALVGMAGKANQNNSDWRTDRITLAASDAITKAPNMKPYVDMANGLGDAMYLLNKPNVSVIESRDALAAIVRAINRTGTGSDYKTKQFEMNTLEGTIKELTGYATSDPDQPAPAAALALAQRIGNRVLDNFDQQIRREAKRAAVGKEFNLRAPEARAAIQQAKDYYVNGDFIKELRTTNGIQPSEMTFNRPPAGTTKAPSVPSTELQRPKEVDAEDWEAASPGTRRQLHKKFSGGN